jgi:hypothetical protein
MHPILRNILSIILGWLGGSLINMGLIQLGHSLLPIPGIDPNSMEELASAMPTLTYEYFVFPFLAHALGTFVGAKIAAWLAASQKMTFAFVIGGLFLAGGIMVNYMIPGPTWFAVMDIVLAYIPMAWIGGKIGMKVSGS